MPGYINRIAQIFHTEGKKQLRLKLIYNNEVPLLGLSTFYQAEDKWFPGKKHFFMPLAAWEAMMEHITEFNEQVKKGKKNVSLSFFFHL